MPDGSSLRSPEVGAIIRVTTRPRRRRRPARPGRLCRDDCLTGAASDKNGRVADESLDDVVDASWAAALGCGTHLIRSPGIHLVPGGPGFAGYDAIYVARVHDALLVYCPESLRAVAQEVLEGCRADQAFTSSTLERIAGDRLKQILGPSSHSFVDASHFAPEPPAGQRVTADDARLAALRTACGDEEWAEAGFVFDRGVLYVMEANGQVVSAGNLTPFRGNFADVGLITHPDHRNHGFAKQLASRMIADALPDAGVVRYRSLTANAPSVAVARSLGFVTRGENLVARLRATLHPSPARAFEGGP